MICFFTGKTSCGFTANRAYDIKTKLIVLNDKAYILVRDTRSKAFCPYSSVEKFLDNWVMVNNTRPAQEYPHLISVSEYNEVVERYDMRPGVRYEDLTVPEKRALDFSRNYSL